MLRQSIDQLVLCFSLYIHFLHGCTSSGPQQHMSPQPLVKRTTSRGIACPVFRDEEGFLSEFVAYYQLHGLNHIRFYNDGSTDNSMEELEPWLQSGFVSIVKNASKLLSGILDERTTNPNSRKWRKILNATGVRNTIQRVCESDCKRYAMRGHFDFYFSIDVDEYMLPVAEGVTLMDAVSASSRTTERSIYSIPKYNFAATPHVLEPIHLLTIEAYKVRMQQPRKLTYFKSVSPKLILHLGHPNITKKQKRFLTHCCNFHNCVDNSCRHFKASDTEYLYFGNGNTESLINRDEKSNIIIFHYSRSFEKFTHKQKTWQKIGTNNFTLINFMDRNVGTHFDARAGQRYGEQVREVLSLMTHSFTVTAATTNNNNNKNNNNNNEEADVWGEGKKQRQSGEGGGVVSVAPPSPPSSSYSYSSKYEYMRPGRFWRLRLRQLP